MGSYNIKEENFINLPEVEVVDEVIIETEEGTKVIKDELPEIDKEFIENYIKEEKTEIDEKKEEKQQEIKEESMTTEKKQQEENKESQLEELFKQILEDFATYLKSKVDEDLLETIKQEIKDSIKEKGGICEIIFLEKVTNEVASQERERKIITSLSYYILLFYNNEIKFTLVTQRLKEKKGFPPSVETKVKYQLLEVGEIDTFGLYEEEGEKKLFLKYKDGRIIEVTKLSEDVKQALILWLKRNGLLLDLKTKYGILGNGKLVLNLFSENVKLKFENPYTKEIKEKWVGFFNPYKRFTPFFLKDNVFDKEKNYTFKKEFIELLKEGYKRYPKVRLVLSYAMSCIIKDWIKDGLSLFPHLWIFSSEGGTGKSTLLHLLRILTAQRSFETAMSIAQIRNVMSVRNNVVLIDDIESFGGAGEIKKLVTSLLKVSATDHITITLGDGDTFVLSTPLAITSNHTPKEVLTVDDALLQRLLLFNLNKNEIEEEWLKKIRDFRVFPQYNNPSHSELAITFYVVDKINNLFTKEQILEKLIYFKKEVYETLSSNETTVSMIKQGYRILDGRFIDIISNLILGNYLFSKVFEIETDISKDIVNFTKIIVANNETYRGESILDDILLILLENHTLEHISDEKEIIKNSEHLIKLFNVSKETPTLIKFKKDYILILTHKYKKKIISEIKEQINKNYNIIKLNEDLKSAGCLKRKTRLNKRKVKSDNGKTLSLGLEEEIEYLTVYEVPSNIVDRLKKEFLDYFIFDLDEGEIIIKRNKEKGDENEKN
jgi:hypothetical protein